MFGTIDQLIRQRTEGRTRMSGMQTSPDTRKFPECVGQQAALGACRRGIIHDPRLDICERSTAEGECRHHDCAARNRPLDRSNDRLWATRQIAECTQHTVNTDNRSRLNLQSSNEFGKRFFVRSFQQSAPVVAQLPTNTFRKKAPLETGRNRRIRHRALSLR